MSYSPNGLNDPTVQLNLTLQELATAKVILSDSYEMVEDVRKKNPISKDNIHTTNLRHNLITLMTKVNFAIERLEV